MTYINLPKKRLREESPDVPLTEQKLLRREFYNNTKWRKLRIEFLKLHPLCEQCLREGRVTSADQVHHKRSPFNYKEKTINWDLGLDPDNLESICGYHHGIEHTAGKDYVPPQKTLELLEALLEENAE